MVNQIVDISDRINHKLFLLPNGIISVRTAWICAFCVRLLVLLPVFYDGVILFLLLQDYCWDILQPASFSTEELRLGWSACQLTGTRDDYVPGRLVCLKNQYHHRYQVMVKGLLSSVAPALANGAVFLATTIPDADGDQLTGKKTFCVKYGEKVTAVTAALFCFGPRFFLFIENNFWSYGS